MTVLPGLGCRWLVCQVHVSGTTVVTGPTREYVDCQPVRVRWGVEHQE